MARQFDVVCLAADGSRKRIGDFTRIDMRYWQEYCLAAKAQSDHIVTFLAALDRAWQRVERPRDLPAIELDRLATLEAVVLRDLREIGPLPDIDEGPDGRLRFLVAEAAS